MSSKQLECERRWFWMSWMKAYCDSIELYSSYVARTKWNCKMRWAPQNAVAYLKMDCFDTIDWIRMFCISVRFISVSIYFHEHSSAQSSDSNTHRTCMTRNFSFHFYPIIKFWIHFHKYPCELNNRKQIQTKTQQIKQTPNLIMCLSLELFACSHLISSH